MNWLSFAFGLGGALVIGGVAFFIFTLLRLLGFTKRELDDVSRRYRIQSDVIDKQVYTIQKLAADANNVHKQNFRVGFTNEQIFQLANCIVEDMKILQEPKN